MLTACAPEQGSLPTHQQIVAKRSELTMHQARQFCQDQGGKLEFWGEKKDEEFCIMPQGYGCEPMAFAKGECGGQTEF